MRVLGIDPGSRITGYGIIDKEGSIHIANVALFDDKTGRGTRTKISFDGDTKVRVGVKSGTKFPSAGL